jgi:hypothetical protein
VIDDERRHDRASLEALHWRVCDGDESGVEEICGIVLRLLRARLGRVRPDADPGLIESAVEDAILKYLGDPRRFDPRRAGLLTWLEAIALRRLADFERPGHRALTHIAAGIDPAQLELAMLPEDTGGLTDAWIAAHRALLVAAAQTDAERAFVEARLAGASREEQARALGVAHLPPAHARLEMNRVWKLICRRARRRDRHAAREQE